MATTDIVPVVTRDAQVAGGRGASRVQVVKAGGKRAPRGAAFRTVGVSGLRRFGGTVNEEFLLQLRGKRSVQVYREMYDNDPVVGASMSAIEQTLKKVTWQVAASEKTQDSQSADRAVDFLVGCMNDMQHSWDDMLSEIVTFLTYGWAVMEMTLKVRNGESRNPKLTSKYEDGRIGFKDISLRMQYSLESWDFDEDGYVKGMYQQGAPFYTLNHIPLTKCMLFRTRAIGNNPEGRAILRNAYRPWYFKKVFEEIEAVGAERDLIGLPMLISPEGYDIEAEENKRMLPVVDQLLSQLRRDEREGIYLPFGWELKPFGSDIHSRRQFDLDRMITRQNKLIAMSVLTHAILLGSDRVGSFALSRTHTDDFFKVAIQGFLQTIASVFNRMLIPFIFSHYTDTFVGSDEYPMLVPGKVSAPSLKEVADYIKAVSGGGFFSKDKDQRERLERDLLRHLGLEEAELIGGVRRERDRPEVELPADAAAAEAAAAASSSSGGSD